jgi:hypothetical protein
MSERSRRGKLQKARQGKVMAGPRPPYSFRYNDAPDNYVVDAQKMRVIERIFRMAGVEGYTMNPTRLDFNREGVQPPSGGRFWSPKCARQAIRGNYAPMAPKDEAPAARSRYETPRWEWITLPLPIPESRCLRPV